MKQWNSINLRSSLKQLNSGSSTLPTSGNVFMEYMQFCSCQICDRESIRSCPTKLVLLFIRHSYCNVKTMVTDDCLSNRGILSTQKELVRLLIIWPSYRPWGKKGVDLCRAFMSTFLSYILIVTGVCPKVMMI